MPAALGESLDFVGDALADRADGPRVITVPAPVADPLALLSAREGLGSARPGGATETAAAWLPPTGPRFVALGAQQAVRGRLGSPRVRRRARGLLAALIRIEHPSCRPPPPRLFGGFAFAPGSAAETPWSRFGDGLLLLPRWSYGTDGTHAWLSMAAGEEPDPDERTGALADLESLLEAIASASARADLAPGRGTPPPGTGPGAGPSTGSSAGSPPRGAGVREDRRGPEKDRTSLASWERQVSQILRAIDQGEVKKAVAARRCTVETPRPSDIREVLSHLRRHQPNCTCFALARGEAAFLGASPERLIRRDGSAVVTAAVAGSATPDEAEALLRSAKDRHEQRLVLDEILETLRPLCSAIEFPEDQELLTLANVVHLRTPVRGELKSGVDTLEIVAGLHPTPAVGGLPREAALRLIAETEVHPRGWYAGPFGWLDATGDAEFIVALRSGLVARDRAWLYAGAGIVPGSDPSSELAETELKLLPMRDAIRAAVGAVAPVA